MGKDPEKEQIEQARVKAVANLRRLDASRDDKDSREYSGKAGNIRRRPEKEDLVLDQYESQIAMEVVAPEDIPVGFEGGSSQRRIGSKSTRNSQALGYSVLDLSCGMAL